MQTMRANPAVVSALAALVVIGSTDVALDPSNSLHLLRGVILVVLSFGIALYLWNGWLGAERSLARAKQSLYSMKAERDVWRERTRTSLDRLSRRIDETFRGWRLTPAETEIAWHLLSGATDRAIARRTGRSVRTVSTHAAAVYRKSELAGRVGLAAFFMENLVHSPDPSQVRVPAIVGGPDYS